MKTSGLAALECAAGSCSGDLMEQCLAAGRSKIAVVFFSLSLKAGKICVRN